MQDNFELFWPKLEERLDAAKAIPLSKSPHQTSGIELPRDERAILNEILELARNQERRLRDSEEGHVEPSRISSLTVNVPNEWSLEKIARYGSVLASRLGARRLDIMDDEKERGVLLEFPGWKLGKNVGTYVHEAAAEVDSSSPMLRWVYRRL